MTATINDWSGIPGYSSLKFSVPKSEILAEKLNPIRTCGDDLVFEILVPTKRAQHLHIVDRLFRSLPKVASGRLVADWLSGGIGWAEPYTPKSAGEFLRFFYANRKVRVEQTREWINMCGQDIMADIWKFTDIETGHLAVRFCGSHRTVRSWTPEEIASGAKGKALDRRPYKDWHVG